VKPESPSRSPGDITVFGFLPQGSFGPLQGLGVMPPEPNIGDASGPQMVMVQFVQPWQPFAVLAVVFAAQLVIEGGGSVFAGGIGV